MDRNSILREIKRPAEANNGKPLGVKQFCSKVGVKESEWKRFWARFSDAVKEAGYTPNQLTRGYETEWLIRKYAKLSMELSRLPTENDIEFKTKQQSGFPTATTLSKLGNKRAIVSKLRDFSLQNPEFQSLVLLCENYLSQPGTKAVKNSLPVILSLGFVYLGKSGKFYKIGKTNSVGRREYELGIQLPEKLTIVHKIDTDDPEGIEAYWHRRFSRKRLNGEWFHLTAEDVQAFKRRKFM